MCYNRTQYINIYGILLKALKEGIEMIATLISIGSFIVTLTIWLITTLAGWWTKGDYPLIMIFFCTPALITSLILLISKISTIISEHWPWNQARRLAIWQARREAIIVSLQNDIVHPGESIEDFNMQLANLQMSHKDPWRSWFTAKWVMEVEPIPTDSAIINNITPIGRLNRLIDKRTSTSQTYPTLQELIEKWKQP